MSLTFAVPPARPLFGGVRQRRARKADTNILAVKFNTLTGPSAVHTGDAVVCSNSACTAILSHLSQLSGASGGEDSKVGLSSSREGHIWGEII